MDNVTTKPGPGRPAAKAGTLPPGDTASNTFHWLDIGGRKDVFSWCAGYWVQGPRALSPARAAAIGFTYWAPVALAPAERAAP